MDDSQRKKLTTKIIPDQNETYTKLAQKKILKIVQRKRTNSKYINNKIKIAERTNEKANVFQVTWKTGSLEEIKTKEYWGGKEEKIRDISSVKKVQ